MALQQCFLGGRKMLLTNLPGSSTHIRHLFGSGLPVRTQKWNYRTANLKLPIHAKISPSNTHTKWLCTKAFHHDNLQPLGIESVQESSEDNDDSKADNDGEEEKDQIDKDELDAQLEDIFKNKKEIPSAEWKDVRKLLTAENPLVNDKSCDAITIKKCLRYGNYSLATSYIHYMEQENREPNLATIGSYLQLCGEQVEQCGEARVLEYYHKLMSQTKLLNVRLLRNAIVGVAATKEWRQALDLMQRHRRIEPLCQHSHSAVIVAAFRMGDYDLGWQLLDTMIEEGLDPKDSVFMEWMRQCEAAEDRVQKEDMFVTLLHKLQALEIFPSIAVAQEFTRFSRECLGWSPHYLKMTRGGRCPACKQQMEVKGVEEEEFKKLQEEFGPRVLMGSDIFHNTDPKEWQSFQRLVAKKRPFSVVVDALNVSYTLGKKSETARQKSLEDVVEQAVELFPDSLVFVLGRQHMKKWFRRMRWDDRRVFVFTIHNMSKDDAFFLYAALQSGLGTMFITSDMLRDHLFRLKDRHLQDTFKKWQRTHQVMAFSRGGNLRLLLPPKFSTVAQQSRRQIFNIKQPHDQQQQQQQLLESSLSSQVFSPWHVPYDDGKPRQSYESPVTWLCLHPNLPLSTPLPNNVSHEPIVHTPVESAISTHGNDTTESFLYRHHHYWFPPRAKKGQSRDNGDTGAEVDDREVPLDSIASRGRPQRKGRPMNRRVDREEGDVSSSFFPAKNRKKIVLNKKEPPKISEVNLSSIFDKVER